MNIVNSISLNVNRCLYWAFVERTNAVIFFGRTVSDKDLSLGRFELKNMDQRCVTALKKICEMSLAHRFTGLRNATLEIPE